MERCGQVWCEAAEVRDVVASEDGRSFVWQVDLPAERLAALRQGEPLESRPFDFGAVGPKGRGVRARFQLFPKGDASCGAEGTCSLWLCTDSREPLSIRLRAGSVEREGGSSEFCRLEDVLRDGSLEVVVTLQSLRVDHAGADCSAVQQSLQLTGLQVAEWRLYNVGELCRAKQLVTSPPFRFHHVLLGDMYLELLPGAVHPEHCALFFRCRVPTMRLRVAVAVGEAFAKTFEAVGKSSAEEDLKASRCLEVNLDVPSVLGPDGSLTVRCALEEVVTIPPALRDMIPKLDERASWPKRL